MRIFQLSCLAFVLSCNGHERRVTTGEGLSEGSPAVVSDIRGLAAESTGSMMAPADPSANPVDDVERSPVTLPLDAGRPPADSPLPRPASVPSALQMREDVSPSLAPRLQAFYDFEHPALQDQARELDQGLSGTDIQLINGGAQMRVSDGAYDASRASLRVQQVDATNAGNDDWKAGIFDENGVATLAAFSGVRGTTILAWVQLTSDMLPLNTNTPDPGDRYNALGIAGLLSGNSDGHAARALLELITVNGELRLVALGRRLDAGRSQTFAANEDYRTLLPVGEWVHVAATFDFGIGEMVLYRNGQPIDGFYTQLDDPWEVTGATNPSASPTLPRGIKLGGSFPQNSEEFNPGQSQLDSVMFIDRVATALEINEQYLRATSARACDCP